MSEVKILIDRCFDLDKRLLNLEANSRLKIGQLEWDNSQLRKENAALKERVRELEAALKAGG